MREIKFRAWDKKKRRSKMPKCELKPWKIGEPQVVFVDNEGKNRLVVTFYEDIEDTWREITQEKKIEDRWQQVFPFDEILLAEWIDELLELLGIPETIEEGKDENL